jgi:hypothetical protein
MDYCRRYKENKTIQVLSEQFPLWHSVLMDGKGDFSGLQRGRRKDL